MNIIRAINIFYKFAFIKIAKTETCDGCKKTFTTHDPYQYYCNTCLNNSCANPNCSNKTDPGKSYCWDCEMHRGFSQSTKPIAQVKSISINYRQLADDIILLLEIYGLDSDPRLSFLDNPNMTAQEICESQTLRDFINDNIDEDLWAEFSEKEAQNFSKEFLLEFADKIVWFFFTQQVIDIQDENYLLIKIDGLEKYVEWEDISLCGKLSNEFIYKYKTYLPYDVLVINKSTDWTQIDTMITDDIIQKTISRAPSKSHVYQFAPFFRDKIIALLPP